MTPGNYQILETGEVMCLRDNNLRAFNYFYYAHRYERSHSHLGKKRVSTPAFWCKIRIETQNPSMPFNGLLSIYDLSIV